MQAAKTGLSLPAVSFQTASSGTIAYAIGFLPTRLSKSSDTPLAKYLLLAQLCLIPAYLIAAIGVRRGTAWGKVVAVATAAVDLVTLVLSEGGLALFALSWMPSPLRFLPILAVAFMAIVIGAILVLVFRSAAVPIIESSEPERLTNIRCGRTWFWWTVGLAFALPLAARTVWWVDFNFFSAPRKVALMSGDFGTAILMFRECWPSLFLAAFVRAVMSAPSREHGLSIRGRKALVGAGLAVFSILTSIFWYIVFTVAIVPLEGVPIELSIKRLQSAFLFQVPGAVGIPLIMCGILVMVCVWVIEATVNLPPTPRVSVPAD